MFSLICVWINGWVNSREAGYLRRYRAHYGVIVMQHWKIGVEPFSTHDSKIQKSANCMRDSREALCLCVQVINRTIWGFVCQKQASSAGTSNYIPQILRGVITCNYWSWYLLLAPKFPFLRQVKLNITYLYVTKLGTVMTSYKRPKSPAIHLFAQNRVRAIMKHNIKDSHYWPIVRVINRWPLNSRTKGEMWKAFPCHDVIIATPFVFI